MAGESAPPPAADVAPVAAAAAPAPAAAAASGEGDGGADAAVDENQQQQADVTTKKMGADAATKTTAAAVAVAAAADNGDGEDGSSGGAGGVSALAALEADVDRLSALLDFGQTSAVHALSVHSKTLKDMQATATATAGSDRALLFCLLGRCAAPTNPAGALEWLGKALKLDSSLVAAWNAMGECYWATGDTAKAQQCFDSALKKRANKLSLRNLSIVLRSAGGQENVVRSVTLAKQAVALDVADGQSWYVLGNSYSAAMLSGANISDVIGPNAHPMELAFRAYAGADREPLQAHNPDLFYNRAVLLQFKEQYDDAIAAYSRATQIHLANAPDSASVAAEVDVIRLKIAEMRNFVVDVERVLYKKRKGDDSDT